MFRKVHFYSAISSIDMNILIGSNDMSLMSQYIDSKNSKLSYFDLSCFVKRSQK